MPKSQTRYYNMLVHLIKNNKLFEENVAIKNVWQKEGNTFLDIYFYSTQKSYVFDALFVHDILDLTNEKYYKDINAFVADFEAEQNEPEEAPVSEPLLVIDKNIFQPIFIDLVFFVFMAKCGNDYNNTKKHIIFDYIKKQIPSTANLSEPYLEAYVSSINPTEEEFYGALKDITTKSQEGAELIIREITKICMADGQMRYLEKMYLAELLQTLREQGVKIDPAL